MGRIKYETIEKEIRNISDCELLTPESEYKNVTTPMRFRCACGAEFITDYHHFKGQNQRQCPDCGSRKRSEKRKLSRSTVAQRLQAFGCELMDAPYNGTRKPLFIRYSCGHTGFMPLNTLNGENFSALCSDCRLKKQAAEQRKPFDTLSQQVQALGLTLVSGPEDYENARSKLTFRCACGAEFVTSADSLLQGCKSPRCERCSRRESQGEAAVAAWLDAHGVHYQREKQLPGCGDKRHRYRFDFVLPDLNTCVEFDGQQHYRMVDFSGRGDEDKLRKTLWDTQCIDLVKDIYCDEHGINLLRIRWDEDIDSILESTLIPR